MSEDKWDKEFETIDEAVQAIEVIKGRLLFGDLSNKVSASPIAEQHYLAAVAALDTAKANFRLADYLSDFEDEEDDDGDD